jgi:hypothetical protein
MAFFIGQKVECIDGKWDPEWIRRHPNIILPKEKEVYTIRGIRHSFKIGLLLEEIRNPICDFQEGLCEPSFVKESFRPLVERKVETDISIFMKMLDTNKQSVDA